MKYLSSFVIAIALILFISCQANTVKKRNDSNSNPDSDKLFSIVPASQSNVNFSNNLIESEYLNIIIYEYFYNGGGVAIGDVNGDGLADIFFTGNQVSNRLYLNKGDLQFQDITVSAGVGGKKGWATGVSMADVNGDGLLDIYVCYSGRVEKESRKNELFINKGDLTFTDEAEAMGIADMSYSTQALFLDFDNDNDLDIFLLNRPSTVFKAEEALRLKQTKDKYAGDKLFRNDNNKFVDISLHSGIHQNGLGYGLGVTAADINGDGLIDIYVTNDYIEPDYMYINKGNGIFIDTMMVATQHMSNFGMGVDIADINNDALVDIFVADMAPADNYRQKTNMRPMNQEKFNQAVKYGFYYQYMFNTLQLNNGDLMFSDIAQLAGVANTDWTWATLFADFDNDGFNDLLVTNGFRKEFSNKDFLQYQDEVFASTMNSSREEMVAAMKDVLSKLPSTKLKNFIYKNNGDLTFTEKVSDWGLDMPSFSNGAAYADLDNDGDLDIVINNIDEVAHIYQNNSTVNNFIQVELQGEAGNKDGIGAKLYMYHKGKVQFREQVLTRGYQSSMDPLIHFGIGKSIVIDSLIVFWPGGKMQKLEHIESNQLVTLVASDAKKHEKNKPPLSEKKFLNITKEVGLDYNHVENAYDDFQYEILLPHKMSQFGPSLAIADIDNDGLDDFYVGGAKGFAGRLYTQKSDGTFIALNGKNAWELDQHSEDIDAVFFDADGDNDLDLYVVSGGNEYPEGNPYYQDRLYLNQGGNFVKSTESLPIMANSGSVVKPWDFDNDGDLDLFVGGRLVPKKYPMPASSSLLLNQSGKFIDVTESLASGFKNIGLITDATWGDIDENGKFDLVLVGEWTSIMIFEWSEGLFTEQTASYGLDSEVGWWFSVHLEDINNDGKRDIIAGNLGLNYKYKASLEEPFHVFYGDYDTNGNGDIILGYYNEGTLFPLRGKQCTSNQMPIISKKFNSYDSFGKATLADIYGEKFLEEALHYAATTFASTVLINKGNKSFQNMPLPSLAQISSINDIICEDFTNDGVLDLLVAGNLYPVEVETTRNDASYGLLLEGGGDGNFKPISPSKTGFIASRDVKKIRKVELAKGEKGVLIARNNGPLELLIIKKTKD